jgi:hypothetical protein
MEPTSIPGLRYRRNTVLAPVSDDTRSNRLAHIAGPRSSSEGQTDPAPKTHHNDSTNVPEKAAACSASTENFLTASADLIFATI